MLYRNPALIYIATVYWYSWINICLCQREFSVLKAFADTKREQLVVGISLLYLALDFSGGGGAIIGGGRKGWSWASTLAPAIILLT